MAFSKAPLRRFNEIPDSTPPPGAYDPKFETDMSASNKGITFKRSSTSNAVTPKGSNKQIFRSRPSSPGPSSHAVDSLRLRSASFQRSNVCLDSERRRRNTSQPATKRLFQASTFVAISSREFSTQTATEDSSPPVVEPTAQNSELSQQLELLQTTLDEEIKKTRSLVEQAEIYENMVHLLRSEITKHEHEKAEWDVSEKSFTDTIKMLQTSNDEVQTILGNFQDKFVPLLEEQDSLKKQIAKMEEERLKLLEKDKQVLETVTNLENSVKCQEDQLTKAEQKCQVLISSMDECYKVCEEKVAKLEAEKDDWKNQATEFQENIQVMQKEIDDLKINCDFEKTQRENVEHELEELNKDSQQNELEDKIMELEKLWAEKEGSYIKTIGAQKEKIKILEDNSMDFAHRANALIEEISESRKMNERLQEGLQTFNQDQSAIKDVFIAVVEEPIVPETILVKQDDSDSKIEQELEEELKEKMDLPEPSIQDEINRNGREELKNMQKEISHRCQQNKLKKQLTMDIISVIEQENQQLKKQIEVCTNVLKLDSSWNDDIAVEIPDLSSMTETLKEQISQPGDLTEEIQTNDSVQSFEKSSDVESVATPRSRSTSSETSTSVKRSATPVQSTTRSRPRTHRRKMPGYTGGSTNLVTNYLDDVPEEDGN